MTEPIARQPVAQAPGGLRSIGCALAAAWSCIGPFRAGSQTRACTPGAVLWALPWLGLGLGLLWTLLFSGTWRLFGERVVGLRLMPALAILLADLLLTGRLQMAGVRAVEAIGLRDETLLYHRRRNVLAVGALAAGALITLFYALLLSIPTGFEWWPSDWRHRLHWMYPRPVFRPLVLLPMWACWSMVLAAGIGRARSGPAPTVTPADQPGVSPEELSPEPLERLAGQATLSQIFLGFVPVALLTSIYASREGNLVIGLGLSLVVFLVVYITAMATALRWRGQSAATILLAGLVGRTVFLLGWLFIGRAVQNW